MSYQKGKKNKLNIGDKVEIKPETIKYMTTNLIDAYSLPDESKYFKREIKGEHLPEAGSWIYSYVTKTPLYGKVQGYGATDYNDKTNKEVPGLQNIYLVVKGKLCSFTMYISERNVKKVK